MTVLTGVGLGLRRDFIDSFLNLETYPGFIEVAPENWMGFGGRHVKLLEQCAESTSDLSWTFFIDWWSASTEY